MKLTIAVPILTEDDDLMFARVRHATSGITTDLDVHLTKEVALAAADFLRSVVDAAAAEFANEPGTRCDHKPMIRTCSAAPLVA